MRNSIDRLYSRLNINVMNMPINRLINKFLFKYLKNNIYCRVSGIETVRHVSACLNLCSFNAGICRVLKMTFKFLVVPAYAGYSTCLDPA